MLGLNGIPVAKMPDNWPDYDLMADFAGRQLTIQVKTVGKDNWNWVEFPGNIPFEYLAIVQGYGDVTGWLIPVHKIEQELIRRAGPTAKSQHCWMLRTTLNSELLVYKDRWDLTPLP